MQRLLLTLVLFAFTNVSLIYIWQAPAEPKAVLVAVFQLRASAELQSRATQLTRQIASKVASTFGYDSRILSGGSAPLGETAAKVGAPYILIGRGA